MTVVQRTLEYKRLPNLHRGAAARRGDGRREDEDVLEPGRQRQKTVAPVWRRRYNSGRQGNPTESRCVLDPRQSPDERKSRPAPQAVQESLREGRSDARHQTHGVLRKAQREAPSAGTTAHPQDAEG